MGGAATVVLVVQHEETCPPAWFGRWLTEAGCALDVRRPYAGETLPADLSGHHGLLVLGGSMNAYADLPWFEPTRALVRQAVERSVPTLGICLGHQLLAAELGGQVVTNPRGQQLGLLETGWTGAAAADPLVREVPARRGIHWNDDVVQQLPEGAVVLAQTDSGVPQVVRFAPTVWGVQLHPEADEQVVRPWADGDRDRYVASRLDAVVAQIAAAHEELTAGWRPLATGFARLVETSR